MYMLKKCVGKNVHIEEMCREKCPHWRNVFEKMSILKKCGKKLWWSASWVKTERRAEKTPSPQNILAHCNPARPPIGPILLATCLLCHCYTPEGSFGRMAAWRIPILYHLATLFLVWAQARTLSSFSHNFLCSVFTIIKNNCIKSTGERPGQEAQESPVTEPPDWIYASCKLQA